ncbi:MAG: glycosyl hydrolase [Chitinophagaceae bacterium]
MMKRRLVPYGFVVLCLCNVLFSNAQALSSLEKNFLHPPVSAKPWVFWYWMQAAVSKEGITADLEAMQQAGIGGAYLMPIKDSSSSIPFQPIVRQATPEWWQMVNFAMQEAKRLNLQLAMHVSDGFALAGGPWIKPAQSMQKLVWTKNYVAGNNKKAIALDKPEFKEDYYKDIAVFAYPANTAQAFSDTVQVPIVKTSTGARANFLCYPGDDKESFKSDNDCWVQYQYPDMFTCRSIRIHTGSNNYQAQRLLLQVSDDGFNFKTVCRLDAPRHGWQDTDEDYTHAIPATTARVFRFVYNKEDSEPGAEDLDAAKWKPSLKLNGIYLSDEPVINEYESKNGSVWRVANHTTAQQVTDKDAVPLNKILNLTASMDSSGNLQYNLPAGNWIVLRMGHTSTGHTNATGGAAKGLECDKFDAAAIKLQFDNWFAKAFENTDAGLAKQVLKIFHVDSWECGSQNWSETFRNEFQKRRGYDLLPYLPAMAGVPVESAIASEQFLHDVRQTIAELISDVFYVTLSKLAHEKGCRFSAESVAPTMVSDGMLHYKTADIPMGEFWLNSPTHDKPNDMLDAISGAHIYGKPIVQAEAFTSVRMNWGEHPGNIKALGDYNFSLGANKMVLHVFAHNPWMDRKPGMTLDGVGVYFQRDQTWWKQGKAWITYLQRCQAMLQAGKPVADIAVFSGEEIPRRSLLPDRLVNILPGIFGEEKVAQEKRRLVNKGNPLMQKPDGVTHSANMTEPTDWADALNGYAYDSFNPDALLSASVKNGKVIMQGGSAYALLVIPSHHALMPDSGFMSVAVAQKIQQLIKDGAMVLMNNTLQHSTGLKQDDKTLAGIMQQLKQESKLVKGKLLPLPYTASSFENIGLLKDVDIINNHHSIAWAHRQSSEGDIYFLSNQRDSLQQIEISFRQSGKIPELWNAVTSEITNAGNWSVKDGRTFIKLSLPANGSLFVVFKTAVKENVKRRDAFVFNNKIELNNPWQLQFDKNYGGPANAITLTSLTSWTEAADAHIKYYSGSVGYNSTFTWNNVLPAQCMLALDELYDIATVTINGIDCGTIWTAPLQVNIAKALKKGENKISITVSNTWANRLIGDQLLPEKERITWTTAPFRLKDKPLLKAGIVGTVKLLY